MVPKKILTKEFKIQLDAYRIYEKVPITVELFRSCDKLLPTVIQGVFHDKSERGVTFGYDPDDSTSSYYAPVVVVTRQVVETDEEYMDRISAEERRKEEIESKEHLEYLRLRAKYEGRKLTIVE